MNQVGHEVFSLSNRVSSDAIYRGGVIKVENQGTDLEQFEISLT